MALPGQEFVFTDADKENAHVFVWRATFSNSRSGVFSNSTSLPHMFLRESYILRLWCLCSEWNPLGVLVDASMSKASFDIAMGSSPLTHF